MSVNKVNELPLSMGEVFEAIIAERLKQDAKWGKDKEQSLAGFLLIIERELEEAKEGWNKDLEGKSAPLNELVQVAASCVAALQKYGLTGNTISTDDIPAPQRQIRRETEAELIERVGKLLHPPI